MRPPTILNLRHRITVTSDPNIGLVPMIQAAIKLCLGKDRNVKVQNRPDFSTNNSDRSLRANGLPLAFKCACRDS
eukprot:scaffold243192_cov18-Prasinocladus_malaysianus.AAC.1